MIGERTPSPPPQTLDAQDTSALLSSRVASCEQTRSAGALRLVRGCQPGRVFSHLLLLDGFVVLFGRRRGRKTRRKKKKKKAHFFSSVSCVCDEKECSRPPTGARCYRAACLLLQENLFLVLVFHFYLLLLLLRFYSSSSKRPAVMYRRATWDPSGCCGSDGASFIPRVSPRVIQQHPISFRGPLSSSLRVFDLVKCLLIPSYSLFETEEDRRGYKFSFSPPTNQPRQTDTNTRARADTPDEDLKKEENIKRRRRRE